MEAKSKRIAFSDQKADIRERSSVYPRRQAKEAKKETCVICFDNDIDHDLMFSVDKCGHRFCLNCVKQHIEVKLLDGTIPNCLQHRCKSQLSFDTCQELLTHAKLRLMWKQRIIEASTHFNERVYCPYKRCSHLMSRTELSVTKSRLRRCFKCRGSFCVDCKVPWHRKLSCTDYKKMHPNDDDAKLKSLAKLKGWRQCGNCHHMVERSSGYTRMTCRCGYVFRYLSGSGLYSFNHRDFIRLDFHSIYFLICAILLLMSFLCMVNLASKKVIITISFRWIFLYYFD